MRQAKPSRPAIQDRPVVLLTGFGPFPTVEANATSVLVPQLAIAARQAFPGIHVEMHILPTEWGTSLAQLEALVAGLSPTVALHFGVSSRATGFEIEVRGQNRCALSEDAAGLLPLAPYISPDGPEYLPATLPGPHIVSTLRRRGIPALLSRNAGGYLCNALLYRSLQLARLRNPPHRTGFIHLPTTLVNERRPALEPSHRRNLAWSDVIAGGLEVMRCALGRPPSAFPPVPRSTHTARRKSALILT